MKKNTSAFKRSWRVLRDHPRVFLPDILFYAFVALVGYGLFAASGLLELGRSLVGVGDAEAQALVAAFFQDRFIHALVAFVAFVCASFVVGSSLAAFKYHVIQSVLRNKQGSMASLYRQSKVFFWRIVGVKLAVFLAYSASALVAGVLFVLLYRVQSLVAFWASMGVLAVFSVVLALGFFFRFPALYARAHGARSALTESIRFFRVHPRFVFACAVVMAVVMALVQAAYSLLSLGLQRFAILVFVLNVLALLVLSTWPSVYVFAAYDHAGRN